MGREQAYRCFTADVNKYLAQLRKIKKNPSQKNREDAYLHVAGEWRQRQKRRQKVGFGSPYTNVKPLTLDFVLSMLRYSMHGLRKRKKTDSPNWAIRGIRDLPSTCNHHANRLYANDAWAFRIVARLQESDWAKEMGFLTPEEIKQMATFPVVRRTSKLTVRGEHVLRTPLRFHS